MSETLSPWQIEAREHEERWVAEARREQATTYVYRYFDADDRLLYVGQTRDVTKRERQHKARAKWFPEAARRTVDGPFPKQIALAHEFVAIGTESPVHNAHAANGYRGPGSLHWDVDMAEEFRRRMDADPAFREAESEHLASRMGEFFAKWQQPHAASP